VLGNILKRFLVNILKNILQSHMLTMQKLKGINEIISKIYFLIHVKIKIKYVNQQNVEQQELKKIFNFRKDP